MNIRKLCGLASVLVAFSFPALALAQATPHSLDDNGIDLVSGDVSVTTLDVAIGGSNSGLSRIASGSGAPYSDNFSGDINSDASGNLTVDLGGSTEIFNLVSGAYVSATGSSNTFSCTATDCVYTVSSGAVAHYSRALTSTTGIVANYATLVSLTKPDGEVINYSYRANGTTTRYLMSVSSSLGWMLKYHVQSDSSANYVPVKVEAINTAVDYCDPAAISCTGETVTWPNALISTTGPTDALGHHTSFNGGMGAPTSIVSPNGVTKAITYYTSGSYSGWVHTIVVGTSTWTYNYSLSGRLQTTTVTNQSGGVRTLVYDTTASQVVSMTDPMLRKTQYTYYAATGSGGFKGSLYQIIAPDATYAGTTLTGGYTQYSYDARGNITVTLTVPKGGGTGITTSATYSSSCTNLKICNKPLTTTDAAGVTTTYTYDATSGNVLTVSKPAVGGVIPKVTYTYNQQTPHIKNSSGALVAQPPVWRLTGISSCMSTSSCVGTSDERKIGITYSSNNVLPLTQTAARGDANLTVAASATNEYRTTTFTYDNFGNVTSTDGPIPGNADTSYYFYDAMNRTTGVIGPDADDSGALTRQGETITYNNDGQVASVATGSVSGTTLAALNAMTVLQHSTTAYSPVTGFVTLQQFYPGTSTTPQAVTQTTYDSLLRVDCVAQRLNSDVYSSLPSSACVPGTAGNDGADHISKFTYNAGDQVLSVASGDLVAPVTTYNASNGTVATVTDGKGNSTTYTYDNFNRAYKVCYPNKSSVGVSSTTDCEQAVYTGAVITGSTLRDGQTITIGYDSNSRVSSVAGAVSETYAYDNFDQITSHTANNVTETYGYDALNGLLSDAQPAGTVAYAFDAYGRRSQLTYPSYGGHTFSVGYTYYSDGTVKSETSSYDGASAVVRAQFSLDNYGRLSALSQGPSGQVATTPAYDTSSRLLTLSQNLAGTANNSQWNFAYNAAWQVKSRSQGGSSAYSYVLPADSATTYTSNGLNQMATANTTSFSYDDRGNLTSDGAVSYGYNAYNLLTSAGTATLTYDASNRLGRLAKSGTTTQFLYDGNDLIAEYNGTTLLRRYLHGPGTDNPLVWFEGVDDLTPHYLTADQQGSITAVTDASGNALAINSYDPYGVPQTTNAVYQSRFGYTGQVWLPEVGLYYYKARMYAPSLGRFLQPDPIGYGGGMNMYAYVSGDPINYTDPWGLLEDCPASSPTCTVTVHYCPPNWACYRNVNIIDSGGGPPTFAGGGGVPGGGGGAADQPTVVVVTAKKKDEKACAVANSGSTGQLGLASQGTLGVFSYQLAFGVAVDSHGNLAFYGMGGGGGGAGAGGDAGLTIQTSDAPTVRDLEGLFGNVSGGGGLIGGGTIDGFVGIAKNGQKILGGGVTAGGAIGETTFAGPTWTFLTPAVNLFGKPTC